MRAVINAVALKWGGGFTYVAQLLRHVPLLAPDIKLTVFVSREAGARLPEPARQQVIVLPYTLAQRTWWEQMRLPGAVRDLGADVLFCAGNQGPVLRPCTYVLLVQNVDPLMDSWEGAPWSFRLKMLAQRRMLRASAARARKVIAVSGYTRTLLHGQFGIDAEAVDVIPYGPPALDESPSPKEAAAIVHRLGLRPPYLLAVSDIAYNKNYARLLAGFVAAAPRLPPELTLAIVGGVVHQWCLPGLRRTLAAARLEDRVRFLGRSGGRTLAALYTMAEGMVFPSRVESFGLPPLEAMAYGVPVAASTIPAVREVCGDAVLYFNPERPEEIAEAIIRLTSDGALRVELAARARVRAARFSWADTVRRTLDVLRAASVHA